jgi:serine/threonine protein kinase
MCQPGLQLAASSSSSGSGGGGGSGSSGSGSSGSSGSGDGISNYGYPSFNMHKLANNALAHAGTHAYMAPEVYQNHSRSHGDYDLIKADIWSLGMTLLVLVLKGNPWNEPHGIDPVFALMKQCEPHGVAHLLRHTPGCGCRVTPYPDGRGRGGMTDIPSGGYAMVDPNITAAVVELLDGMLNTNPDLRWTLEQILAHRWFRE